MDPGSWPTLPARPRHEGGRVRREAREGLQPVHCLLRAFGLLQRSRAAEVERGDGRVLGDVPERHGPVLGGREGGHLQFYPRHDGTTFDPKTSERCCVVAEDHFAKHELDEPVRMRTTNPLLHIADRGGGRKLEEELIAGQG